METISDRVTPRGDSRKKKVIEFSELKSIREKLGNAKIVHCHGVFDVLHAGHLAYFESAKKFGDLLVVTVTADQFVNKGPGRPYFTSYIRASMLAAFEVVDFVAVSNFPTAVPSIEMLSPDFYVKGPDYKDKDADSTGGIYLEEQAVERGGGKLVFTSDETWSSSTLINGYFKVWSDAQQASIDLVKKAGGLSRIEETLEKISKKSVTVIGEPIVDSYVFCTPESISSKSPSISAKFNYSEDYAGGALAIANHLADFVGDIRLCMTHGDEPYFHDILSNKMDSRIKIDSITFDNIPTPRKTRFITSDLYQRIFEVTDLRSDQWLLHSPDDFCRLINKTDNDLTVVADFGHGLIENSVIQSLSQRKGFLALNVQTNSSNLAFNPFTKHKHFSFLSIDTKEARIAYHDRYTAPVELARRIREDHRHINAGCAITQGPNGAVYFPRSTSKEYSAPAFADSVVDATGAGDAFFGMTSLLVNADCPPEFIPFIGNVFAGLKTKVIGNKFSVTKSQLIKSLTAILK